MKTHLSDLWLAVVSFHLSFFFFKYLVGSETTTLKYWKFLNLSCNTYYHKCRYCRWLQNRAHVCLQIRTKASWLSVVAIMIVVCPKPWSSFGNNPNDVLDILEVYEVLGHGRPLGLHWKRKTIRGTPARLQKDWSSIIQHLGTFYNLSVCTYCVKNTLLWVSDKKQI